MTRYSIRTYLLLLVLLPLEVLAQSFTTKAPSSVDINGTIRLQYVLSGASSGDFSAPSSLSADFDILNGPALSSFENYQVVNGKATSSKSVTYTYILAPKRKGTFKIQGASVKVGTKVLRSQQVTVVVGGSGNRTTTSAGQANRQPKGADDDRDGGFQRVGSKVTERDLYFTIEPSKRTVWEQEPIMLSYKFYSRVGVGLANISLRKRPDLKGFWTQEVQLPPNMSTSLVNKGGTSYRHGTYLQYFVFPQQSGSVTIPGVVFDADIVQRDASIDMIDAFFNGAGNISLKVQRRVPDLSIQVKPLPTPKPADFSGGVGHLEMSAEMLNANPATNDVATLRIHVRGNGNLKLLKAPKVLFPKDFDSFEPKTEDKTKITYEGVTGEVVYDYTFVPRNVGTYTIPAIALTYFDTVSGTYKTLKSQEFTLKVKQGKRSAADAERDIRLRTSDIRPIQQGYAEAHTPSGFLWWGTWYYWLAVGLIIFIGLMTINILRRTLVRRADVIGRRSRRAGGRASKQLAAVTRLLDDKDSTTYYTALDEALHTYLTDKLSLPSTAMAEAIVESLSTHGVDEKTVKETKLLLDDCAFARFSPRKDEDIRQSLLDRASSLIENLQRVLKIVVIIALPMFLSQHAMAQNQETKIQNLEETAIIADSAYAHRDYIGAAQGYAIVAKQAPSAQAYYNLGNAYYRLDEKAKAVLAYERALRLDPGHTDARFNLEILNARLADQWANPSEVFFFTLLRQFVTTKSVAHWTFLSLVFLVLFMVFCGIYLLFDRLWIRKAGFTLALVCLVLCVASMISAAYQVHRYEQVRRVVVKNPVVETFVSPTLSAKKGKPLHEGTTLTIIDTYDKGWLQAECPDGSLLWLQEKAVLEVTAQKINDSN